MAEKRPLFTGLTRQPELAGIPISFWAFGGAIPTMTFLVWREFYSFLIIIPVYLILRGLAKRDPYMAQLVKMKLFKTPGTPNKRHWGGNSYGA